ncbi:tRNA synthetases class I (E and q), anti-codon binding domain-containing protein [Ditylenchus destructor]|uniref:tRNA synthetases class I (E and q), anti-codon binding domain-containing protein n=1 Tax=Ditylenchus destructor TaxID=166010 RepID=A0AAD4MP56_9BILA|nr:tRNA synthetases class I (E and q), anti-codon binding domain-containing protein [Ditylenchus destructor]
MVVLNPLKVYIENYDELGFPPDHSVQAPHFPDKSRAENTYTAAFSDTIFIEMVDFLEKGGTGYKRLTGKQPVGLRYANLVIHCRSVKMDEKGVPVEVVVRAEKAARSKAKPKAFIHWEHDRFQFERIGYFCVDKESTPEKAVFNRTILLKEDREKNINHSICYGMTALLFKPVLSAAYPLRLCYEP